MASCMNGKWNMGRDKRCSFPGKDVLIMMLTTLKYGGHWDFIAKMFRLKGLTFELIVVQLIKTVAQDLYDGQHR